MSCSFCFSFGKEESKNKTWRKGRENTVRFIWNSLAGSTPAQYSMPSTVSKQTLYFAVFTKSCPACLRRGKSYFILHYKVAAGSWKMQSEVFSDNRLVTGHSFHTLRAYFQWKTYFGTYWPDTLPDLCCMGSSASREPAAAIVPTTFLCITETWSQCTHFSTERTANCSDWTTAPRSTGHACSEGREGRQLGRGTATAVPKQTAGSRESAPAACRCHFPPFGRTPGTEGTRRPVGANTLPGVHGVISRALTGFSFWT